MATQVQESMSESAAQVVTQAGEKVEQVVELAKQETVSRMEAERERVAEGLYTTAHAIRQVGQQLREQEQNSIASVADRVAQRAENASGYLRSRDLPQLIDETERLGRTHPLLFAGGAIGLGLLGVRFIKSTRRQQPSSESQSGTYKALHAAPYDMASGQDDTGTENTPPNPGRFQSTTPIDTTDTGDRADGGNGTKPYAKNSALDA